MDRRLIPANARVAALPLKGIVAAPSYSAGVERQLSVPVADLLSAPHGKRERQILMGERLTQYESREGWAFVQAKKDGYVGYLPSHQLEERPAPSHWVCSPATHVYSAPNLKSRERCSLSFGSQVLVSDDCGTFWETPDGFIPKPHVAPMEWRFEDPLYVASLFLGTPYLWGGNSRNGIDCSGLVQAACLACGISCPGDSDLQMAGLGNPLAADEKPRRGDLLFWKGHVALVFDAQTILHANGFHMAVQFEDLVQACERISAAGDGAVLAHKRLPSAPHKKGT